MGRGGSRTCHKRVRQPLKRGRHLIYFIFFLKNLMKLKKIWSVGGGARKGSTTPPLGSATDRCTTPVNILTFVYTSMTSKL